MRSGSTPTASVSLDAQLAALEQMELEPLRAEWLRLYRTASPPRLGRDLLARGIAYKLQEAAHGGLRPAARRKLSRLIQGLGAAKVDQTTVAITLRPGATLVRTWRGQTHTVQVLDEGYEYQGQRYRSLTQIAASITGAHWSGPRFFGLTGAAGAPADEAA